ncbi:MAG: hypothetical protein KAH23_07560, partial [Kiritimatiellae bacterium]|nr:hypothetical protein [Kiritimatiellia bacterium]
MSAPVGSYQVLLDGTGLFTTEATRRGNSIKPKIVLGSDGLHHAVWHDDGDGRSQILYSQYDGSWSHPEIVVETNKFDLRNANIDVDSNGRAWVAYEDTSWGPTEISVSVRDEVGWNTKTRITNSASDKGVPSIKIDSVDDVHLVWEDNRNGHWEIFWATWEDSRKAWQSSAQFGEDTVIAQFDKEDPYQTNNVIDFKNPKLSVLHPRVWMTYEARLSDTNESIIYLGFRDLDMNFWASSGAVQTNEDGDFAGTTTGTAISPVDRFCVNPTITSHGSKRIVTVAWEDHSLDEYGGFESSQIWGRSYSEGAIPLTDATQITSHAESCRNPSVGAVNDNVVIIHERTGSLFANTYDTTTSTFNGSATGGEDYGILTQGNTATNPAIAPSDPSLTFTVLYDYDKNRNSSELESIEFPDYRSIGESTLRFDAGVSSLSSSTISSVDTKEFAFGDFSENVGMMAHWRDPSMYFGYDARPYSLVNYSTKNTTWPDDRVLDLFVDVFGNMVVASFGGLVYHNTFTGQSVTIPEFTGQTVRSIKWINGNWFAAAGNSIKMSADAGKTWTEIDQSGFPVIDLTINDKHVVGINAVGTQTRIAVYDTNGNQKLSETVDATNPTCVTIDEADVIWLGTESGVYRIENFNKNSVLQFDQRHGMRSSYVHDIITISKHLRYIATPTGVEKMYGSSFDENLNVHNTDILNDNVFRLFFQKSTNSLWLGSMHQLHEIVFRDPEHEVILNENVAYSALELLTENRLERDRYFMLDVPDGLTQSKESAKAFINRNPISFGFVVGNEGQAQDEIDFLCDLLIRDEVETELSDMFSLIHDFTQLSSEQDVIGFKQTLIKKVLTTSTGMDFYLKQGNDSAVLLDAGIVQIPFATIMLDTEKPMGCISKLDTISRTQIRFRIVAHDEL